MQRSSGVLMHISSLPTKYGIGSFGKEAYRFVDFLKKSGQEYWQILPLNPVGFGYSPYQSHSTHAGNYLFIDLDMLIDEGLLSQNDIPEDYYDENDTNANFIYLEETRPEILRTAYRNFIKDENSIKELDVFSGENPWLKDFAAYMVKKELSGGAPWFSWENKAFRNHEQCAVDRFISENSESIDFWRFVQYKFYYQWKKLKKYANENGIKIIGDIPIYVSDDSADVWANRKMFPYNEDCRPEFVAGCPPDCFSADGQNWGNPVYDWPEHIKTDFSWWRSRLETCSKLFDVLRIDHFRGLESYYRIPYGREDAKVGEWVKGPGEAFIDALKKYFPNLDIIAEDLGFLTEEVYKLLKYSGYPGMKVLQFSFGSKDYPSNYIPHRYERNCVVYVGTHDNDTIYGWFENDGSFDREYVKQYAGLSDAEGYNWGMIRLAMSSHADLCIITMQDLLALGGYARMNEPSTVGNNWLWRAKRNYLDNMFIENKLLYMTEIFERKHDHK